MNDRDDNLLDTAINQRSSFHCKRGQHVLCTGGRPPSAAAPLRRGSRRAPHSPRLVSAPLAGGVVLHNRCRASRVPGRVPASLRCRHGRASVVTLLSRNPAPARAALIPRTQSAGGPWRRVNGKSCHFYGSVGSCRTLFLFLSLMCLMTFLKPVLTPGMFSRFETRDWAQRGLCYDVSFRIRRRFKLA